MIAVSVLLVTAGAASLVAAVFFHEGTSLGFIGLAISCALLAFVFLALAVHRGRAAAPGPRPSASAPAPRPPTAPHRPADPPAPDEGSAAPPRPRAAPVVAAGVLAAVGWAAARRARGRDRR